MQQIILMTSYPAVKEFERHFYLSSNHILTHRHRFIVKSFNCYIPSVALDFCSHQQHFSISDNEQR